MTSQPDILQSCLEEAAKAAKPALERCIEQVIAALQTLETQSMKTTEREELSAAWHQLQDHKLAWSARYQAELLGAFNTLLHTPAAEQAALRPAPTGKRGLNAFSLVDDADINKAIESSRLLQHILPRVEQPLAELDTLISSAQGLPNVQPELNPLRPEVFARVLQELMAANTDAALMSRYLKLLADPLGKELRQVYEKAIRHLALARVQAAHYRVLPTPAGMGGRPSRRGAETTGGTIGEMSGQAALEDHQPPRRPSQYADLSNYEIRNELFQDFLFHDGSNAHHGLAPSYYATVDKELAALKAGPDSSSVPLHDTGHREANTEEPAYRAVNAVDRPPRFVDITSTLSAKVWGAYARSRERAMVRTQLKKNATKVGQVLGLEVVRKLVSQVAQDPRLLVPVREAIVALEPSLLRLAMVDPRFFSDEGHPGRRLMERVGQRSFKYNDEYSPEFLNFFQAITRTFNELNTLTIEDAGPFGMALSTLEEAWDSQDQKEFDTKKKVLQALHFAEDRQERADHVAFDLSARSDLDHVPGVVLDFLFGPWSLAMAHARLVDQRNQVDPEGFGSVVPDLIWSVKRDVTLKRPAKLIEMIPGLLEKLHAGLQMLGQDRRENEKFFEALMKLHQPVLKLRRLKSRRDAEESSAMPLLEAEELATTPQERRDILRVQAAGQPWLARSDLDAAGFEDTLPTEPGELAEMDGSPDPAAASVADSAIKSAQTAALQESAVAAATVEAVKAPGHTREEAEAILLSLRTGNWVDFYSRHQWLRAQLIWASTKATLFMFLSHGGQPHSMTKRSCEKLIMQRWLRPVDTHGVVAQALHAVASQTASAAARQAQPEPQDEPETV